MPLIRIDIGVKIFNLLIISIINLPSNHSITSLKLIVITIVVMMSIYMMLLIVKDQHSVPECFLDYWGGYQKKIRCVLRGDLEQRRSNIVR